MTSSTTTTKAARPRLDVDLDSAGTFHRHDARRRARAFAREHGAAVWLKADGNAVVYFCDDGHTVRQRTHYCPRLIHAGRQAAEQAERETRDRESRLAVSRKQAERHAAEASAINLRRYVEEIDEAARAGEATDLDRVQRAVYRAELERRAAPADGPCPVSWRPRSSWCECGPEGEADRMVYFDRTSGADGHGWACSRCRGIVQIG